MNTKTKSIVTKSIYILLIVVMLCVFVYLSEKYKDNNKEELMSINDYYSDVDNGIFEVVNGTKLINIIRNGKSIIFIGSKTSDWSTYYIKRLNKIVDNMSIDKIYYYDINNDKVLLNSNYYEILDLLDGYLLSTDNSNNNLFAPSLYIIENGRVLYYNVDTAVMKNTLNPSDYWTDDTINDFNKEIEDAINKYYLNN